DPRQKALFDHVADPHEETDRFQTREGSDVAHGMAVRLADQYNALSARALSRRTDADIARRQEALAAMGYIRSGLARSPGRMLPPRILPADPVPDGPLGW